MEAFLSQIEWVPVIISTIIAFMVGWLWYSPKLFVKPWLAGLPEPPKWQAPMWMPMVAQFTSTLFLAVLVNWTYRLGYTIELFLIVFTLIGFTKANGMYAGKSKSAIMVEVWHIFVMAVIMYVSNLIL